VRLLLKNVGECMPEAEIQEQLEALHINVQAVMQLRSKRRDQDSEKDRPLTPHFIVLVARGPDVAKVRSLTDLCDLRLKVETYNAPNGPLQRKRCQRFGYTQRNCGYAPRCVACGDEHHLRSVSLPISSLSVAAEEESTLQTILVAVSGKRRRRPLQGERKGSVAERMATPRAQGSGYSHSCVHFFRHRKTDRTAGCPNGRLK
jgi:hypothetical protein